MGKSMAPGGGGRFAKLKGQLMKKGYSAKSAAAIAASIGFKKYGKKKMLAWAAKARKRNK